MTKKVFYEKRGRTYHPIAEYDSDWSASYPPGNHLVMCYPGGHSRKYNVDPAYAPMIAASRVASEVMCKAIMDASKLKPTSTPITKTQRNAWDKLAKSFGVEMYTLQGPAVQECVTAGLHAMQEEANKLLTNPSVKKAYDHFLIVCELTKEETSNV